MLRVTVALVCVAVSAAAGFAQNRPGGDGGTGGTGVDDYKTALEYAQGQAGTAAQLIRSRMEQNNTVYGFYFWAGGKIVEIEVFRGKLALKKKAATTLGGEGDEGKVSKDVVALIEKNAKEGIKLPEGRILELAADSLKGKTFTEVAYASENGRLVLKVGDQAFDAQTGTKVELTKAADKK